MLSHVKDILPQAQKEGYAIGAFNTFNLESTQAIIRGAVAMSAPVIVQVSESTIKYAGLKPITHIVKTIAKNESNSMPVVLHLDHGKDFRSVVECVKVGFSSIHMDGSSLPYDENVAITKQAVEYAHKCKVWAQGELGTIMGVQKGDEEFARHGKSEFTDPDQAANFVEQTGVDTLAISVGNSHGLADDEIDLDRLKAIREKVKVPLILHGGSGIQNNIIKQTIQMGISVVNIDSDLRKAFIDALKTQVNTEEADPRNILKAPVDAISESVKQHIVTFNSEGKGLKKH